MTITSPVINNINCHTDGVTNNVINVITADNVIVTVANWIPSYTRFILISPLLYSRTYILYVTYNTYVRLFCPVFFIKNMFEKIYRVLEFLILLASKHA